MQQFFYDNQIRRFVLQFVRILSNFQIEFGSSEDGTRALQRVPVRFATINRQTANILKDNSASAINSVPMISVYISGLKYDRPRVQEPTFIDKMRVRFREYDADSGTYSHLQGNAYTIERLMPVPYQLEMKADIWTSNIEQKLQLLEQMLVLFNPSLEIQSTDNYIDWTSLSFVELTDVQYSSISVPVGQEDSIDIASLSFTMPIWISSPAKVKKLGVIQRIVNGLYDYQGDFSDSILDGDPTDRKAYTPLEYGIILLDGQVTLLKAHHSSLEVKNSEGGPELTKVGDPTNWPDLINLYGKLIDGISQIRLYIDEETMVVGTVSRHPTDETLLLFNVDPDTIPANDLAAVDAIIDPLKVGPNSGLAAPLNGTRYLLTQDVGHPDNQDGADAWKGTSNEDLVAKANDIIQYNGSRWVVSFNSQFASGSHYVTNLKTGLQYKWHQGAWTRSYEGRYRGGTWSLVI